MMNFLDLALLEKSFENVFFSEKEHSYVIDGEKCKASVTQILKKYTHPFDTERVAKSVASKEGVTIEDVLGMWEFKKNYGCHKGTQLHLYIENFIQRKKSPLAKEEINKFVEANASYVTLGAYYQDMAKYIANFQKFYEWWKEDHILVKPEFVIGDKKTGICGCIDNLSFNKNKNALVIFDYKSNKQIKRKGKEKMLGDLNHLDNCELTLYSLQLWLYTLIICNNTPFIIEETPHILWLAGEDYELIPALDLKSEASLILQKSIV